MTANLHDETAAAIQTAQRLIEDVMATRFSRGEARSPEYKAGVRAVLEHRALGRGVKNPFAAGTAQSDAWFAGLADGNALWREQAVAQASRHPLRRQA